MYVFQLLLDSLDYDISSSMLAHFYHCSSVYIYARTVAD